ncbi:MAG: amino acid ABC transporter ATP-binding protein [Alphaproteobacteria bacterium]|nr:amino acid ABC transporter ATP-binding protein [Alphaproteobacteria bacterium]
MIRLAKVDKRFGSLHVLRGLDLEVPSGTTLAVLGPSGSGKSTLVRCINHLERIQAGTIEVDGTTVKPDGLERDGRRLAAREIAQFRTGIGMVFQSFNLFPHLTVLGNVIEAPIGVLGWPREQARERAIALLKQVNLAEKADAYPATLSGGQQQRVAIVRSLVMDPKIMLFDEPTSALDPELTGEVLRVIKELAIKGRTAIIVTHEVGFAREVATDIAFMDEGRVIERGPPDQVIDAPREERTRAFLRKLA